MLTTRKPGPPVPPRPSAAAVANALARHRENSPSPVGVHTLKPPHPGRTVVYKSPGFDQDRKPQHNGTNGSFSTNGDSKNGLDYPFQKTEVYLGESNALYVPRPILPVQTGANHRHNNTNSNLVNGKLMYTSTCSIIEINSSSSASTSASSSPMSTLQKPESVGRNERNHHNSADEDDTISSQKQLKNSYNHRHLDSPEDASAIRRNSPDVIVINSTSSEHDSGTEQNSIDTNSIASSNSLERENNLKNLENRQAHMTEIIIGGSGADQLGSTTTVVTNGTSTIIEARNDALLTNRSSPEPIKHVIRTSSIRLPYRPEPEGGEHVSPSADRNTAPNPMLKPPSIDPKTIDSKLSEKKVAFHELLISELTAMRQSNAQEGFAPAADSVSRRQRCPPETRSSTDVSPNGTASRPARIRTADWIEVGDNGKEVVLSSCQISLEDSGMEDEEKLDDASSGVGDSWDSVKDAEERITMSLPGLPPLPKSLSGFDLAGHQLSAHQQHHLLQQQQHQQQQQHHQLQQHHHRSSHQQHHLHPPQHQPPPPPSQQQLLHHQQQQQQHQLPPSLNHHPTNPFIPIGINLQSVSMASLVSQHGHSPVSTVSSGNSIVATPNSGSSSSGGNGGSSIRKPTNLDTQLAILRREMPVPKVASGIQGGTQPHMRNGDNGVPKDRVMEPGGQSGSGQPEQRGAGNPNPVDVFRDGIGPQGNRVGSDRGQGDPGQGPSGEEQQAPGSNPTGSPRRANNEDANDCPTSRQLAARQVMGKDLPTFSGNPEEWPIWISNFQRSTSTCGFSMDENLIRLQRSLKGPALEAVRSRLLCPTSVPHVIRTLEMRYGRPETLIRAMSERIRQLPPPRVNDLDSIIEFGLVVDNLVEHLKNVGQQSHLSNPSLLHDLVGKLPVDYRLKWSAYKSCLQMVDLATFGAFMATLVELAYDVADDFPAMKQNKPQKQKTKERAFVQTHSETISSPNSGATSQRYPKKPCAVCKAEGHRVPDCGRFKSMTIDEKLKMVNLNGLCRSCLNQHGKWPCKTAKDCGINDCRLKHHTLLHSPTPVQAAISSSHLNDPKSWTGPLFRIIPVTLYGNNCQVDIYAFVVEGSQITLLEDAVAEQLGLKGNSEPLSLQWTGNIKRSEPKSRKISTEISGVGTAKRFKLVDARTVGGLLLPSQTMNYQELSDWYPHLRGLPLRNFEKVSPKLLIGLDNLKLTVPLKIREGGWNDPMAAKSRIGWSIYGSSTTPSSTAVCGFHVGGWTDSEQDLNQLVRDYITLDNIGVSQPSTLLESEEDKRARKLLESATRRVEGGFETALLWRWDDVRLPNSYGMAYKRLRSLEKRLSKDPDIYERVRQQIREYEEKGYAHKATQHELSTTNPERCWYLPLGIVLNPKKPNKLRIIWDAAATVDGISLNSALLKGPDFLTSLPAVMSNFRLYRFALTGDIKEMFHRYFIREQDRQYLRFLFRDGPDQDPIVYVMNVAIFGASCSPSCALYIKNLNAREFEADSPRAVAAIIHRHYVDDYLDSFGTAEEAVKIGREVKRIHANGGFEIRNFLSNDSDIAAQVGSESTAVDKDIRAEKGERIESVLGMKWIPSIDCFTYTISLPGNLKHVLEDSHIPTKREVLRTVMSFFDPLGLIAFFLIHGRVLMQDIWAAGIGWDDQIHEKLWLQWRKWIELLPKLSTLRIPRCYFPDAVAETYSSLQVHVFVDASRSAYACAVYFRIETPDGPDVILVAAKSKVAPLKMLTVPRLELQAAVLGSRLLNSIVSMHGLPVTKRVLWSDSATVLAWIRSDQRRYHQFVGFRIGEILSTTDVNEWRKVPSGLNVSDDATKWGSVPNISSDSRWFRGPDYLRLPEESWPGNDVVIGPTEEELISCNVHQLIKPPLVDASRFSRWERLHRAMAYVHRVFGNYHRRKRNQTPEVGPLTKEELKKAETTLWRQAQQVYLASEITVLEKTKGNPEQRHGAVSKSSPIFKLWPFMDKDGIVRKRNRLGNAEWIPYGTKYPVCLPRQHRITFLLADSFHRRFRHSNRETVVNELRQFFEIPNLRSLVAEVSKACMWCKVYGAQPHAPPMAPLPKVRLMPYVRPFTYVGLDFFGPLLVKVGRSNAKRWIALFTCLTVRAVHLEVVHSLSTESCVMAVRRFVSRRGSPAEIFSDNATNFHGANNQLKREVEERNERLATVFTNSATRWSFIPPGAPHMGGAWERMVKSVKAALGTILDAQRRPSDEVLETVVIEAEAMVNTRPLTYIPLESADQEALTPNHFILGSSSGVKQLPTMPVDFKATLYGLRQLDLSLLSQLWALNESIQEFRTMLQEQETLSPPSPTPSNSDVNSVSSDDDDEDDSSNTQTVGVGGLLLSAGGGHNLIESVAAASVLSSSQASRMRAPPPPPPNRKAPSRPV